MTQQFTPQELSIICSALHEYRTKQFKMANINKFNGDLMARQHCFAVAGQAKNLAEKISDELLKF